MDGVSTSLNNEKPDPMIGKVIDKYVILERLGKGGMGLVYKAQHQRIKRYAALKLLPARESRDEVSVKRLEREATAMGNLQHPAIATMYDFGMTEEGQPYIVLELMRGDNLKNHLKQKGRLAPEEALEIFLQISDAMAYAHGMGLMHRDLKPENIMFVEDPNQLKHEQEQDPDQTDTLVNPLRKAAIKVLDFGIARHTEESLMLTKTGQIVGSASYMSPEQCSGKKPVDTRTDIYSLGVIMYEMLTGSLPYKGETFLETIYLKTTELPAPFPENLENPPGLENLILKCLMLQPEDRPQTMVEVHTVLKAIADDKKPAAPQSTVDTIALTKIEATGGSDTGRTVTMAETTTRATTETTAQDTETQVTQSPKKLLLAAALVGAVSLLTVAILALSSSKSETDSVTEQKYKQKQKPPLATRSENKPQLPESKNTLSGTGSGVDFLMGKPTPAKPARPEETAAKKPTKSARSVKSAKTTRSAAPPPSSSQSSPAPARTSLPPVAPPYQTPATNSVTSSPSVAPAPVSTGTRSGSISKDPSYYQRQYQKYKKTGKRIDKKIRQFLRKF